MTDAELQAIRERYEVALKSYDEVRSLQSAKDVPVLLAEVERAREAEATAKERLIDRSADLGLAHAQLEAAQKALNALPEQFAQRIAALEAELAAKDARIAEFIEYIDWVRIENEAPSAIAYAHGWRCPADAWAKGEEYRKRLGIHRRKPATREEEK